MMMKSGQGHAVHQEWLIRDRMHRIVFQLFHAIDVCVVRMRAVQSGRGMDLPAGRWIRGHGIASGQKVVHL